MTIVELGFQPSKFAVKGILWRTDELKLYKNTGTYAAPAFTEIGPEGVFTGEVRMYAGTEASVATGWVVCDGQELNRTTEAALFAVIGTLYGVGDGSTTFNVPDFQTGNEFPRGATDDAGRGNTGGSKTHTLTGPESGIAAHSHSHKSVGSFDQGIAGANMTNVRSDTLQTGVTGPVTAVNAHNNEPQFLDIHFIIKK